jgi:hypothetical protein
MTAPVDVRRRNGEDDRKLRENRRVDLKLEERRFRATNQIESR